MESFPSVSISVHQWFDPVSHSKGDGGSASPKASSKAMDCEENPNHKAHKGHRGLCWDEATFYVSFVICVAKLFLSSFVILLEFVVPLPSYWPAKQGARRDAPATLSRIRCGQLQCL